MYSMYSMYSIVCMPRRRQRIVYIYSIHTILYILYIFHVYYIYKQYAAAGACSARNLSRHFWATYAVTMQWTMLDAINLLLENVLNGEYAQRLADIIYVNDFDFDEPIAVHIRHSKRFPVAS